MYRLLRLAPAALFVGLSVVSLNPQAALAADECDTTVVDGAHVLSTAKVTSEADKLKGIGVDVRVRTFAVTPPGGLNAYTDAQVAACPSWRGVDGQLKADMIVYLFSVSPVNNRQDSIQFGANWQSTLGAPWPGHSQMIQADRIRQDFMEQQLNLGDYTGAIVTAESETYSLLPHPPAQPSYKWVWWLGGVIGALVALALVVWRVRAAKQKRGAQRDAQKARDEAQDANVAFTEADKVNFDYTITTLGLNEEDSTRLTADKTLAAERSAKATGKFSAISNAGAGNNPDEDHTIEQYAEIRANWEEAGRLATEAEQALNALRRELDELTEDKAEAPATLARLRARVEQLEATRATLVQQGFDLPEGVSTESITALLDEATKQIDAKKYGEALDELEHAEDGCEQLEDSLDDFTTRRAGLVEEQQDYRVWLAEQQRDLQAAKTQLDELERVHNPNCWQDLSPVYDQAAADLEKATHLISDVADLISLGPKRWDGAEETLEQVSRVFVEFDGAMVTIDNRFQRLADLKTNLPATVADFISTAKARGNEELAGNAERLQSQLAEPQPSYLEISAAFDALVLHLRQKQYEAAQLAAPSPQRSTARRQQRPIPGPSFGQRRAPRIQFPGLRRNRAGNGNTQSGGTSQPAPRQGGSAGGRSTGKAAQPGRSTGRPGSPGRSTGGWGRPGRSSGGTGGGRRHK